MLLCVSCTISFNYQPKLGFQLHLSLTTASHYASTLSYWVIAQSLHRTPSSVAVMLPPTDSLRHQNLKLAELISSIQTAQAPPPACSPNIPGAPPLFENDLGEDDDEYDHLHSQPATITVNIDACLRIQGHGNTVVLSPSSSPAGNQSPSSGLAAASTATQRTSQSGRVEKLTSMVLTALKNVGLLDSIRELDGQATRRPIDIHVDAGISLEGNKNTVCSGLPKLIKATGAGAVKVKPEVKRGEESMAPETRKRRACSVRALYRMDNPGVKAELIRIPGASKVVGAEDIALLLNDWLCCSSSPSCFSGNWGQSSAASAQVHVVACLICQSSSAQQSKPTLRIEA